MIRPTILLAVLAALALGGCQAGQTTTGSGQSPAPLVSASSPSNSTPKPDESQESQTPPAVPDDLKTDAYHWYGLSNSQPINFEISSGNHTYTGSETVHLQSVSNGKAIYEIERTGGLGDRLGTDTVSLQKDGIYVTKSTKLTSDKPTLDMPASVAAGATWHNVGKYTMEGEHTFEQNVTFRVVGEKPLKTAVGAYGALLVSAIGQMTMDDTKYRMESKEWYVKDRGLVKNEISMTALATPKAKPQLITIEETK